MNVKILLGVIFVVSLIAIALVSSGPNPGGWPSTGRTPSPESDQVISISTPCGVDQLDAYRAYEAITKGDFAALAGLSERGKVITLESGVQVHSVMVSGNLSNVRATSGRHVGEYCWLATSMLR